MARIFFCLAPACFWSVGAWFVHPALCVIIFIALFGLGWHVTQRRLDRGESFYG